MDKTESELLVELKAALLEAVRESWNAAVSDHEGEHFYAYILFASPCLNYVIPSFNTVESLAELATDDEIDDLRWSPSGWIYFSENKGVFKNVDDILSLLDTNRNYDDESIQARRWDVFIEAFKQLEEEELFGSGETRNALLVNILCGAGDAISEVKSARLINPKPSYLRFAKSQLDILHQMKQEEETERSMYKDENMACIQEAIDMVENDLIG